MGEFVKGNDFDFVAELARAMPDGSMSEEDKSKTWRMAKIVMQAFLEKPQSILRKKIQAVAVSTDFAQTITNAFNVTIAKDNFDMGWQAAFREVPVDPIKDFWEIYDVVNGITFKLVPEGGRIDLEGISGTVAYAHLDYYAAALGFTDKMIRYRQVAAMLDKALLFRNQFYKNKADNHYALLAAASALNPLAWQAGTGQLARDILTLNRACFNIGNRVKDKGYGDPESAEYLLYFNPLDKSRILAALAVTTAMIAQVGIQGSVVNYRIRPISTFSSQILQDHPVMVLPGNKLQMAEGMAPTTFTVPKDPLTLNEGQAVWSIYGAAVGDTDQCEQLSLS